MKTTILTSAAALLALAACGDEPAVETESADMAAAEQAGDEQTAGAMIAIAEAEGVGSYLVDGEGRALYILEGGESGEGGETVRSDCTGECAVEWPPLTTTADPQAGEGIDAELLSSVVRQDSTRQVTYDGMPLYYYHDDTAPGDIKGQDVHDAWGSWYLISPEGDSIEEEAGS